MNPQRTLFNFDIPPGMLCKPGPCQYCGHEGPYHSFECGLTRKEKEDWLEMVRSTGPCGQILCGEIITTTCQSCRFTSKEEGED